jgi:spore germination cell wall hydrolase CwlJ-like protein
MDVFEQLRAFATSVAARLRAVEVSHNAAEGHLDTAAVLLKALHGSLAQLEPGAFNVRSSVTLPFDRPTNFLLDATHELRITAAGPCLLLLGAVIAAFGVPHKWTAQDQELARALRAVLVPSTTARVDSRASIGPSRPMLALYADRFAGVNETERDCLRRAVYYEARGEPVAGQIAVAQVVLNRVKLGRWGSSICRVIHQGVNRGKQCQFSFACRSWLAPPRGAAWQQAMWVADEVLGDGAWLREMSEATHFHRHDLAPAWRRALKEIGRIGAHVFYAEAGSSPDISLAPSDGRAIPRQQLPFADNLTDSASADLGAQAVRKPVSRRAAEEPEGHAVTGQRSNR